MRWRSKYAELDREALLAETYMNYLKTVSPIKTAHNVSAVAGGMDSRGNLSCAQPVTEKVFGRYDMASGAHLDTVAELSGVKRKPGEPDNTLRARLYKVTG